MALFERVAAALFGGGQSGDAQAERALVTETVDSVVDAVEPRCRMDSRYQSKLAAGVRHAIAHLRAIGREGLEPMTLSREAWASDQRVNAFFARADDIPGCLGRSHELRGFFDQPVNAGVQEAYALLGMKKEERGVLGMELRGETVQREVAQTVVSFSGHRLIAPAATLAGTRLETGRRILMRLAQVALGRIVAADAKATDLGQHKAYLASRKRVLLLARDGMEGLVNDPAKIGEELKAVERELDTAVAGYIEAKASGATLEGYFAQIEDVFAHAEDHVSLGHSQLRVSTLGVRVDAEATGPVNEVALAELALGKDFRAAIAIVRCARGDVPSKEALIADAERHL